MSHATRSLELVAQTTSLKTVRDFFLEGAAAAELTDARMGELDLLIEEVFTNVCRHAYPDGARGSVTITYAIPAPGELSVEFADQGVEFNPLAAEPPDLSLDLERRPVGGLGIFLVRTFARSLTYRRESGWNRLRFAISAGC